MFASHVVEGAKLSKCEQFRFEHFNTVMSVEIVGGLQLS